MYSKISLEKVVGEMKRPKFTIGDIVYVNPLKSSGTIVGILYFTDQYYFEFEVAKHTSCGPKDWWKRPTYIIYFQEPTPIYRIDDQYILKSYKKNGIEVPKQQDVPKYNILKCPEYELILTKEAMFGEDE